MTRRPPVNNVMNMNGPSATFSQQIDLWRERVQHEQWATTRAHPFTPVRSKLGRDARLRNEITLALQDDKRLRAVMRAMPPLPGPSPRKFGRLPSSKPLAPLPATAMPLGSQTVLAPMDAGSLTARELQQMRVQFKNEPSTLNPLVRRSGM